MSAEPIRNAFDRPSKIGAVSVTDIAVPKLAELAGVVAVSLGGSRARGTHAPDSDWDIGLYYRSSFDARLLADLGFDEHVVQPRVPASGVAWASLARGCCLRTSALARS